MRLAIPLLSLLLCACGSVPPLATDASVGGPIDAPDAPDPPDPPGTPLPAPGRELAPAAGRLSGGTWTVDVQFGAAFDQATATGGGITARGGSPLIP